MPFLQNFAKFAVADLANQYAVPVKSLVGAIMSRTSSANTGFLSRACLDAIGPDKDDNILEIGYGRGNGLQQCMERIRDGRGMTFGLERSQYMEDVVRKKFILEIEEENRLRLDRAPDLRNLPYPSDFFAGIFHVDLFYFIHDDVLGDVCRELHRILRPGARLVSAMEFNRLRRLQKWGILTPTQWDPVRYLSRLEPAGFVDVKLEYVEDGCRPSFQLLTARKADAEREYFDPEERMRQLEADIKRELVMQSMVQNGYKPTPEDLELLREHK